MSDGTSAAEWVAAIGTVSATFAAVWLGYGDRRARRLERAEVEASRLQFGLENPIYTPDSAVPVDERRQVAFQNHGDDIPRSIKVECRWDSGKARSVHADKPGTMVKGRWCLVPVAYFPPSRLDGWVQVGATTETKKDRHPAPDRLRVRWVGIHGTHWEQDLMRDRPRKRLGPLARARRAVQRWFRYRGADIDGA